MHEKRLKKPAKSSIEDTFDFPEPSGDGGWSPGQGPCKCPADRTPEEWTAGKVALCAYCKSQLPF